MSEHETPRCRVVDGFLPAALAAEAAAAWPAPEWDYWLQYRPPLEHKRAAEKVAYVPAPLREALQALLLLPAADLLDADGPLVPDAGLRGAGLHDMESGWFLDLHRDSSHHADCGLERRANAILYLTPGWREEWGGALELWPDVGGQPGGTRRAVAPLFNRLVVFEADVGYHGVPHPVGCPAGVRRQSLAVYFYGRPRGPVTRPRARFVAYPGRPATAAEEELRLRRMAGR